MIRYTYVLWLLPTMKKKRRRTINWLEFALLLRLSLSSHLKVVQLFRHVALSDCAEAHSCVTSPFVTRLPSVMANHFIPRSFSDLGSSPHRVN